MKKSVFLIIIALFSFLSYINKVLAHNSLDNHSKEIDLSDEWNLILAGILVIVYIIYHYKFHKEENFIKQSVYFIVCLLIFYIAVGSPLHELGDHYLFSAHMLEQSLVYFILPPFFLLSLPISFIKPIVIFGLKYKILSFLTKPLLPLLLFNILFSFYHLPLIFNYIVSNIFLHNLTHSVLSLTAIFMWVPLIPVIKELDRLSEIQKIGYIFASGILLTPACALIIFSDTSFYTIYISAPQLYNYLPLLIDQQTGGIIMKVIQEMVYGIAIGIIFLKWAKTERMKDELITSSEKGI